MTKDELILKMGDEMLRMSRHLSKLAEKKMAEHEHVHDMKLPPKAPAILDLVPPPDFHRAVEYILKYVGEDPERPDLKETPERFRKALDEMLGGYKTDINSLFKLFDGNYDELVVVKDIPFTSFCEHHFLQFSGVAHIGYIPQGKIVGLSKAARVVDAYARRLQVQERLTMQIETAFRQNIPGTKGTGCIVQATHSCMACRGVRKPGVTMVTSALSGVLRDSQAARAEFFSCVGVGK